MKLSFYYCIFILFFMQDMINLASKCWKNTQGQNSLTLTSDKSLSSQKKEQSYSRHSIQSKLTRLYFEELSKVPHATPDSVLVCSLSKHSLLNVCLFFFLIKNTTMRQCIVFLCNMLLYFKYYRTILRMSVIFWGG